MQNNMLSTLRSFQRQRRASITRKKCLRDSAIAAFQRWRVAGDPTSRPIATRHRPARGRDRRRAGRCQPHRCRRKGHPPGAAPATEPSKAPSPRLRLEPPQSSPAAAQRGAAGAGLDGGAPCRSTIGGAVRRSNPHAPAGGLARHVRCHGRPRSARRKIDLTPGRPGRVGAASGRGYREVGSARRRADLITFAVPQRYRVVPSNLLLTKTNFSLRYRCGSTETIYLG